MTKTRMIQAAALGVAGCMLPGLVQAAFVDDSKATLGLRNFYMNSDNRQDNAAQSKAEEWAQGFRLDFQSGFTEGAVGFGVDATGLLGIKLDSGSGRTGTLLLPAGSDGAPDEYSSLGATLKARVAQTTLRAGTLIPKLPVVMSSDTRLLPQTFQGYQVQSSDIDSLSLTAGRLTDTKARNSSGNDDMTVRAKGSTGTQRADQFDYANATYNWTDNLLTGYSYGHLDDNYTQHTVNLIHTAPRGNGQLLRTDVRVARSLEEGRSNIDNTAMGARFTYSVAGHALSASYQEMRGDTGFAYLGDTDAYLVNYVMLADFAAPDEKSWQLKYEYDFARAGVPGLKLMTRYTSGDGFDTAAGTPGKEWERDTDISYTIQSGPLKNVGILWRNATYRSNLNRDVDQNRLIFNYSFALF
ncbi:MAG TPA: outer membrane porin, OprD family [Pseudomonas sp.]|nr:outer membrane porin, OprD family [Pseudomonas sp.]HCA25835.1 outer membrane porin, OprD family [Pseudomonas sp.]